MTRIPKHLVLGLALSVAAARVLAQNAPAAPVQTAPAPASTEERIQRLEKLLAETRAQVEALKAAAAGGAPQDARITGATDAKLAEIERRIEILAQEIEAMKIGEAAQTPADQPAQAAASESPLSAPAGTVQDAGRRFGLGLSASKVYQRQSGVSAGAASSLIRRESR